MTAQAPGQPAHGPRDYRCGLCGTEFRSNLPPGDITCECDAQLCPHCGAWFGYHGEVPPGTPKPAAVIAQRDYAERELNKLIDETAVLRERHRQLLGRFTRASDGYRARMSGIVLMREYRDAGLPVPDELAHLERHEAELERRKAQGGTSQ